MNWKKLISDLIGVGLTQAEIAKATNCAQTTISELSRGINKDPRSSNGFALIAFAKRNGIKAEKSPALAKTARVAIKNEAKAA